MAGLGSTALLRRRTADAAAAAFLSGDPVRQAAPRPFPRTGLSRPGDQPGQSGSLRRLCDRAAPAGPSLVDGLAGLSLPGARSRALAHGTRRLLACLAPWR